MSLSVCFHTTGSRCLREDWKRRFQSKQFQINACVAVILTIHGYTEHYVCVMERGGKGVATAAEHPTEHPNINRAPQPRHLTFSTTNMAETTLCSKGMLSSLQYQFLIWFIIVIISTSICLLIRSSISGIHMPLLNKKYIAKSMETRRVPHPKEVRNVKKKEKTSTVKLLFFMSMIPTT